MTKLTILTKSGQNGQKSQNGHANFYKPDGIRHNGHRKKRMAQMALLAL